MGDKIIAWAKNEPGVRVLILMGSRASPCTISRPDEWSDWDFQVVTNRPHFFYSSDWVHAAGLTAPLIYVVRVGRLGHTLKVSAVFREGDLDLVLIPAGAMLILRWLVVLRLVNRIPKARQGLADFSQVLRQGYRVVKGTPWWQRFFERVSSLDGMDQLSDEAICLIADGYVCDFVSTWQKIQRGEWVAAQRWLHINLGEVNFRLYYEYGKRQGGRAFADGRRIEWLSSFEWRDAMTISAAPNAPSLWAALGKSQSTFCKLMLLLVGTKWRWPDLKPRGLNWTSNASV